ncbi:MAG: DNA mismatch repair endonuclease MutL [Planctomycetaceae bacterium]|nr:DNA mismatch repair endonuclease MutL [Planctomycetaceae bacterium]
MSTESPPPIQQLSTSVINKIAAGEVIERPASVVKELMENSVDAGADQIEVILEKGGADLIRVSDDGWGIPSEQLLLSVASHATSKIQSADDLFAVDTLGFRGEALASIAEVSQLRIRTKVRQQDAGFELSVNGGQLSDVAPCACSQGTTLEVRNLFFNTPVRRKFMRTTQTELGHASEAFTRIALAYPQVQFSLQHNQRTLFDLPAVTDWRERIAAIFGSEVADALIWVESEEGSLKLSGYVANPTHSRSSNKMQYLFLNGRHIKDRSLQHALGEAYRGLLLTGRYPISFLRFEMEPDTVDVNVHPCKLEVRFQDGGRIYSQLLGTLRSRFLATDLTARVETVADSTRSVNAVDPTQAATVRAQVTDWARGQTSNHRTDDSFTQTEEQVKLRFDPGPSTWPHSPASTDSPGNAVGPADRSNGIEPAAEPERLQVLQAHNRYLVTACEEGLIIIDQHALHERILYEQFREKAAQGEVEVQRLLSPEPVDLAPSEAAAVLENEEILRELGIHVSPFGGDTVLVSGYPAMLSSVDPVELIQQIAKQLVIEEKTLERRDILDELLNMMSCKAAIKSGDSLSAAEIATLIEHRGLVQDSHHCPHGRPTTLVFTQQELDRRFKRI